MKSKFSNREVTAMQSLRSTCTLSQIAKAFGTTTSTVEYAINPIYKAWKNAYDAGYRKGRKFTK